MTARLYCQWSTAKGPLNEPPPSVSGVSLPTMTGGHQVDATDPLLCRTTTRLGIVALGGGEVGLRATFGESGRVNGWLLWSWRRARHGIEQGRGSGRYGRSEHPATDVARTGLAPKANP